MATMGTILGLILVNWVGSLSGPLKWVIFWCKVGELGGAHSNEWDFGCNMGALGGLFKWPNTNGEILSTILVNYVG